MKFEEAWFVISLLSAVRKHHFFGKTFHAGTKERQILEELGWIEK